jgi:hypothetical protein
MNLQMEVIIMNYNHYSMENGNKGLSARVIGSVVDSNNRSGVDISDAQIPNYGELTLLSQIPASHYPAKFKANIGLVSIKDKGGKDKTGVSLSNLQFVSSMKLVESK